MMKEFKVGDEVSAYNVVKGKDVNGKILAIHDGCGWIDTCGLVGVSEIKEPYTLSEKEVFIDRASAAIGSISLSASTDYTLEKLFDAGCRFVEMWHGQIKDMPTEGTWLLKRGEKVFDTSEVQTESAMSILHKDLTDAAKNT